MSQIILFLFAISGWGVAGYLGQRLSREIKERAEGEDRESWKNLVIRDLVDEKKSLRGHIDHLLKNLEMTPTEQLDSVERAIEGFTKLYDFTITDNKDLPYDEIMHMAHSIAALEVSKENSSLMQICVKETENGREYHFEVVKEENEGLL